jgi:hypothetical protein
LKFEPLLEHGKPLTTAEQLGMDLANAAFSENGDPAAAEKLRVKFAHWKALQAEEMAKEKS